MHECTPAHDDILVLSGILDAFDEGLLIVGPDDRVACINRHLQHLLDIIRDVPVGTDADRLLRALIPRICGESGRTEIAAFLSGRSSAADFLCAMRLPGGGEGRFRCSCRAVHEGRLRGSRLVRFSPEPSCDGIAPGKDRDSGVDAAKRRRIEEILRESEDRYRFLVENLNEGIALIDREGIVVFANQKMADLLGCPVARIIGAPVYVFVDEECAGDVREFLQHLGRNVREVFEFELVRRDGTCIHTLIATTPIIDTGGTCRGFLAGVQDITPLKQMEANLRESEEKYRSLVELSAEATLIHRDGRIIFVNPAGLKLLGASRPEEVIGKAILDIVHPDARDTIEAFSVRDLQGEETPLIELLVVRLDGATVPIEGRGTRTIFEGRPAVQVVMRDVSHRKQAEEQLQARNRHLLLLNRIIGTSASTHLPGELLETALNQTLDLLGYDGGAIYRLDSGWGEATLQCWRNMPDTCLELAETVFGVSFADTIAAGLPCYLEQDRGPNTPGSRLLRELGFAALACIPLVVESDVVGALLIGSRERGFFSHDERALLEAVGREIGAGIVRGMLYRRLEVANREANLYLDILTHDIRNADNVANIYADLLIDELEGEPARHARKLKDGIRKSIEITANVATLRKIQEVRNGLARQNLHDVIREEIAHFPDLCIRYCGQPVEVFADDLLPEVFTNLIGNAAKHGGPGVEVTVAVDDLDEEGVVVTVADTGPGVPDEAKEAIFFRFEREGGRRGSQGLGLSICRMLAARYGGRIWVEDRVPGRPGEGAAFRFSLRKAGHGGCA
ncbi:MULTISPECIES: PAS domain S-box protein [Methanoculleus]|uniref:histidine kinase n=2 Tax=Methanoculleus TaxID=45989 RepID=A3CV81_METMJ|nr:MULTISPECIES: PAS domain S-box protein [Methanoculleus]ABN57281.1 multi-sensor signal transduction histidine kinase [Methanoculleus marisnigri JR1]UYU18693.1 PAS domain S-box protein [Methanoculleus submarinus]